MGQIITTLRPSSSTNSENTKKRKRDNSSCSKEDEIIITSSLPSSSTPRWEYEVFLSFYGEDTRRGFTDHLHADLKRKGIVVFRDDETLQQGECISQALLKAIQQSQYAIVILSENYASSKWCLMELAEIVEWKKKTKLITIIPIFYHVDPSDVRNQKGTFEEAFAAYENDPKVDIKEIDTWRKACKTVGGLKGEHIHDRYESTIIQKVCGRISHELNSRSSRLDYNKLVAIDSHADEMMKLLDMESNDVRFIGIHGLGGIGKTTLAEVIYDRVSCRFEGSSFIYFREESRARRLASLQKQLLHMIIKEKVCVWDHRNGSEVISRRLRNKKVFIVLDDVDSYEQLTALAGERKWFGPGSRVIITCRDSHLLITHCVNNMYEVQLLETPYALQLFSLSAFNKNHPPDNYKYLSMDFVNYAGGLPLALKVLGSFLFERKIDAWESARDKLEAIPKTEIFDILKISFDGLDESQQKLFLDLACFSPKQFLPGFNVNYFKEIYLAIDFEVLVDKSLLSKSSYDRGRLDMHDLLKQMCQEIVRREDPEEPGRRSRLYREEDVFHVLEKDTGTDAIEVIVLEDGPPTKERLNARAIEGIVLNYGPPTKERLLLKKKKTKERLNARAFSKMRKLRFLQFKHFRSYKNWRGNPLKYLPSDKLKLLHWDSCPSESWPSSFQPKDLVVLSMSHSRFKRLWEGSMVLNNLKEFDMSNSLKLIEIPDLSRAPKLEIIDLSGCTSLCEVHPSIGTLRQLQVIKLMSTGIKQLWNRTLVVLDNLKELNLSSCWNLIEIPNLSGAPNLERINCSGCTRLYKIHPSIGFLERLKDLSLEGCPRLGNFLNILGDMTSLEMLRLPSSEVSIFPSVICSFSSLESLRLTGWSRLEKFPDLSMLECLKEFKAYGTAVSQIPSIKLIPKSIRCFKLIGGKRMPRESRDLVMPRESRDLVMFINDCSLQKQSSYPTNRDIGSPVEFETEGKFGVHIHLGNPCSQVLIQRWSLGSRIPEWVHNKSNGSSLFFDMCNGSSLDGNTMSVMGIAIFIVCQFHPICPVNFSSSKMVVFPIWLDDGTPSQPFFQFYFKLSTDGILDKPIVLWQYLWNPRYLWKSLDKRKISTTAKFMDLEVKEWGMHLVCPDDAALGLGSDLDSFVNFSNLALEMRHYDNEKWIGLAMRCFEMDPLGLFRYE